MSEIETKKEIENSKIVENYISDLPWSENTPDSLKTLVHGNLRAFYSYLLNNGVIAR